MNDHDGRPRKIVSAVIASSGRPEILYETILSLLSGTRLPDKIVIVAAKEEDLPALPQDMNIETHIESQGLTRQRNAGISRVRDISDILLLIDDDIIFQKEYLENMISAFERDPDAVLIMGEILKNGDISLEAAKSLAANDIVSEALRKKYTRTTQKWGYVYGANMAFRSDFFKNHRFDERLPLYGMMEDVDIGTLARRAGNVGYYHGARCVHLRYPGGRISQRKLGFSEIMNSVYLAQKGSVPWKVAIRRNIIKKPISNIFHLLTSRDTNRLSRLYGNLIALSNLARGNIAPEKVLDIP